jgi:hypothetical protein
VQFSDPYRTIVVEPVEAPVEPKPATEPDPQPAEPRKAAGR